MDFRSGFEIKGSFGDHSHKKLSVPLNYLPEIRFGLILVNNVFNESIPRSLCRYTYLALLDLSRNRLSGKIPKCLENLKGLGAMLLDKI
uniref:Uncharacterized protein n=1 Tax=Lactuca sativa TaxID=4236 RepID=A0A9R1WW51_LACSA|nr:hypothetical protein LSAT_V11C800444730 [Lactuca sativa]